MQDQSSDWEADVQTIEHIVNEKPLRFLREVMACLHSVGEVRIAWLSKFEFAL